MTKNQFRMQQQKYKRLTSPILKLFIITHDGHFSLLLETIRCVSELTADHLEVEKSLRSQTMLYTESRDVMTTTLNYFALRHP